MPILNIPFEAFSTCISILQNETLISLDHLKVNYPNNIISGEG
jgi:hypothetical protein